MYVGTYRLTRTSRWPSIRKRGEIRFERLLVLLRGSCFCRDVLCLRVMGEWHLAQRAKADVQMEISFRYAVLRLQVLHYSLGRDV